MKKFWIVLLSVALIMAFAMPVCAADVKFSGSYLAQGYYDNNRALLKDGGASVGNVWQRLRVQTEFKVQEGLSLTTRFDAMEKIWGASRSATPTANTSAGNNAEAENIKFEHVYVTAGLWGGVLKVGYQQQSAWGLDFGNSGDSNYGPRVSYQYTAGPWNIFLIWDKYEGSKYYSSLGPAAAGTTYQVDSDAEKPAAAFWYTWDKGNAGLLVQWIRNATSAVSAPATPDLGYKAERWLFVPYFRAQMGALYLEGEIDYLTGKTKKYEVAGAGTDVTAEGLAGILTATYDFAPMYAGISLIYVAGDDAGTSDKDESGNPGGSDFNPCLLLFNYDLARWNGAIGPNATVMSAGISNAQILQVFVGVKPMPKLDVKASYTIAQADKDGTASGWVSKNYGSELDLTATYKIYDNLSYMVGFAYLWAGDYFKGTTTSQIVDNDYLGTHKLTLTF